MSAADRKGIIVAGGSGTRLHSATLSIEWPEVGAPPQLAANDAAASLLADAAVFELG